MFRNLNELTGRTVEALDGAIGRVKVFYLDDVLWMIRYLAVETDTWIPREQVLISAASFIQPSGEAFPVNLSKEEIRNSPDVDLTRPVSRGHEIALSRHYGWPHYWENIPLVPPGGTRFPSSKSTAVAEREPAATGIKSTEELALYGVMASDGPAGVVSDYVVDDADWKIYYLVVDARAVSPGKRLLLSTMWVDGVIETSREVRFNASGEKMRGSPAYDASRPPSRAFEERLFDYFGMPRYWRR
ncbi:MAG: hypothetical protein ACYC5N_09240 [Endomicrobiales bacterium]